MANALKVQECRKCEYRMFGDTLRLPSKVFDMLSRLRRLDDLYGRVEKSLQCLFSGVLSDPKGFSWAVACTPDKKDGSQLFSISGMLGCVDEVDEIQVKKLGSRGVLDLLHDDSVHPGVDVMNEFCSLARDIRGVTRHVDEVRASFAKEWDIVRTMAEIYVNGLLEIKQCRIEKAEEAEEAAMRRREKAEEAKYRACSNGGSFGRAMVDRLAVVSAGPLGLVAAKALPKLMSAGRSAYAMGSSMLAKRAAGAAKSDVVAWNISDDELQFFSEMNFDGWAQHIQDKLLVSYQGLRKTIGKAVADFNIEGWGAISENERKAENALSTVRISFDKKACFEYMLAKPYDLDMAVEIARRYGAEVGGLRDLQRDAGNNWEKKCKEVVDDYHSQVDTDDEDDVKAHLRTMRETFIPGFYGGDESFVASKIEQLEKLLNDFEVKACTVGGFVCSSREAASFSRTEQGQIDYLVSVGKVYPFGKLEELIDTVNKAAFKSEYSQWVLDELINRRRFMLTVDGEEYDSLMEATDAFKSKVEEVRGRKIVSNLIKICTFGNDEYALKVKYWPGSLDPDTWCYKVRCSVRRAKSKEKPELSETLED